MTTKPDTIDLGALQREVEEASLEMVRRERTADVALTLALNARARWNRARDALNAARLRESA